MPKNNDSDDENDSCVFLGTSLADLLPEDAKFSVKPKRLDEQIVTDEKGRQRFHGAFTGGYSAGYFNTVGSKDGWTPSTFKSSIRDRDSAKTFQQRPEDFMDDEDFSEHGIAPKALKVKADYHDELRSTTSSKRPLKSEVLVDYEDIVKPTRSTIGVRMLKKMGWREGQGIGSKIKRRLRKLKKTNNESGTKIYGVTLPSESDESELDEDMEDAYLVSRFDVKDFQFQVKEDLYGLGYKRLDVGKLFGQTNQSTSSNESLIANMLFPMFEKSKANKKGMSGHAFGVGDFEDDEDIDVYQQDALEAYDFDLDSKNQKDTKKKLEESYGFGAFDNDIQILKLFVKSKTKQEPVKVLPGPVVPPGFDFIHKFKDSDNSDQFVEAKSGNREKNDSANSYISSVMKRGELLGEKQLQVDSVFDLMSEKDRKFLHELKQKTSDSKIEEDDFKKRLEKNLNELASTVSSKSNELSEKESKEKRYEMFLSYIKKDFKDPYSFVDTSKLTEWDKQKEEKEFTVRYENQMKLLEKAKASNSRFVSTSTLNENNEEVNIARKKEDQNSTKTREEDEERLLMETNPVHRAAREKKFGQLTRVEFEWRPHPTLCKRFNIPNPYPDTKEYGTVKDERAKLKLNKLTMLDLLAGADIRFDKSKSKSLFDEINNEKTLLASSNKSSAETRTVMVGSDQANEQGTEFEAVRKGIDIDDKPTKTLEDLAEQEEGEKKEEKPVEENVYLKERPSFDIFKAIFEGDEEEDEEEAIEEPEVEEEEEEKEKEITAEKEVVTFQPSINLLKDNESSLKCIFLKPKKNENEEKPKQESSSAHRLSTILKNLAKSESLKKSQSSSEDSSSSSDSSSSDEDESKNRDKSKKDKSSSKNDSDNHHYRKKKKKHHKSTSKKEKKSKKHKKEKKSKKSKE